MIPPKEQIIENMAQAIRVCPIMIRGADIFDAPHEYLDVSKQLAEAALQALLSSLPNAVTFPIMRQNAHFKDNKLITTLIMKKKLDMSTEYYKQLLGMKK